MTDVESTRECPPDRDAPNPAGARAGIPRCGLRLRANRDDPTHPDEWRGSTPGPRSISDEIRAVPVEGVKSDTRSSGRASSMAACGEITHRHRLSQGFP